MTASGGGSGRHAVGHAGVQYSDQYGDQSDTQSGMQPVPSVAPAYDAQQTPQQSSQQPPRRKRRALGSVVGIIGEIFLTLAVVCALYIVWQLWWTGVVSEQTQEKQSSEVSWTAPSQSDGSYQIAKAQKGDPPIIDKPSAGDVVGQIYIPRFGAQWKRLIVEGTTADQLARHGLGHYPTTQLPGEVGNFAVAGHRSGYGEPLGNVPDLKEGDPIVIRTGDYWYVYHYTSHEIVLPSQTAVVAPVPNQPNKEPTERFITLTTCEPRYTSATHRWISYGTFDYWAKVSDGIPKELASTDATGAVQFVQNDTQSWTSQIPRLTTLLLWLVVAYAILYIAGAIVWRYPAARARKASATYESQTASIYGWIYRHQPGIAPIRWLLMAILVLIVTVVLFEWVFPWAASTIPFLRVASNYSSVV